MALLWCDETHGAVALLIVVPLHERAIPLTRGQQALKRPQGIAGSVFQCPEQRLRIGVVVTDRRATEGGAPSWSCHHQNATPSGGEQFFLVRRCHASPRWSTRCSRSDKFASRRSCD
jgi:hypothetical protein